MIAVETARAADRAYFQAHPTHRSYTRPLVPGECPPSMLEGPVACVVVARVRSGAYLKAAVYDLADLRDVRLDLEAQAALPRGESRGRVSA